MRDQRLPDQIADRRAFQGRLRAAARNRHEIDRPADAGGHQCLTRHADELGIEAFFFEEPFFHGDVGRDVEPAGSGRTTDQNLCLRVGLGSSAGYDGETDGRLHGGPQNCFGIFGHVPLPLRVAWGVSGGRRTLPVAARR